MAVEVEELEQKSDWNGNKILQSLIYCDNWLKMIKNELIKNVLAVVQIIEIDL